MSVYEQGVRTVVSIGGRKLTPSVLFDEFWMFAAERQAIFERRLSGRPRPWTDDPILDAYRFTNCYRFTDRTSQFLIASVIGHGPRQIDDLIHRILLFKLFNRIETWQLFESKAGEMGVRTFAPEELAQILASARAAGASIYGGAYLIPPPPFGAATKHENHLRLLDKMREDRLADRIGTAASLREVYAILLKYPGMGSFLAYQFAVDINYSSAVDFSENEFVQPGPGAIRGIRKCFGEASRGIEVDIIRYTAESQVEQFEGRGLRFGFLRGRMMSLVDCQNIYCEIDKYARRKHPQLVGGGARHRLKRNFAPSPVPVPPMSWPSFG